MLDFSTLVIEQVEKGVGVDPKLVVASFILAGFFFLVGIVSFIFRISYRSFPAGLLPIFAASLCLSAGFSGQRSILKNVVVKIEPTVENLEQNVNGETIVKRGKDYYFVDSLPNNDIKKLQARNRLNETVNKHFEETVDIFK